MTSLEGDVLEYALRVSFSTSNNKAEYEVLITGITMCKATTAEKIKVYSDFQLVAN